MYSTKAEKKVMLRRKKIVTWLSFGDNHGENVSTWTFLFSAVGHLLQRTVLFALHISDSSSNGDNPPACNLLCDVCDSTWVSLLYNWPDTWNSHQISSSSSKRTPFALTQVLIPNVFTLYEQTSRRRFHCWHSYTTSPVMAGSISIHQRDKEIVLIRKGCCNIFILVFFSCFPYLINNLKMGRISIYPNNAVLKWIEILARKWCF